VRPGRVVVSSPRSLSVIPRHSLSVVPCCSSSVVPCCSSSVVPHHPSSFHPWPASRAVARKARVVGASSSVVHRCRPWSFVVPPSFFVCCPLGHLLLLLSYGPGAPTIHPTSSCSSAWGWVLCCSLSSSPLLSFVVICCHLLSFVVVHCHCPCLPSLSLFALVVPVCPRCPRHCCPHRRRSSSFIIIIPVCCCRLLSSFVVVVRSSIPVVRSSIPIIRLSIPVVRSSIPIIRLSIPVVRLSIPVIRLSIPVIPRPPLFFVVCRPSPHSTCSPPHEQLLVRLGVGGGVIVGAGGSRFRGEGVVGCWGAMVGLVCVVTCCCQ
jgi:hypothetical protein